MSPRKRAAGVAVVTGATGGMGRIIAARLASRGMHVVAIARDPRRADDLQAQIARGPGSLEVIAGDLSTRTGVVAAAASIAATHESVQLLIPSRVPSWTDLVTNCLGAAAGVGAAVIVTRAVHRRQTD